MKKIIAAISLVMLMSASCSLLGSNDVIAGVGKTVNGGADWQLSNSLEAGVSGSLSGLSVSRLAFDPGNRQIVFAAGYNDGLYKSEDSGQTWKRILSNILVYDFQVDPRDAKTIYAAGLYAAHGRVLVTKDGGGSWTQIFNDPSDTNPVRAVAVNPSDPAQVMIGLANGNVVKSFDAGLSWQFVRDFGDRVNRMSWQNGSVYILLRTKGLFASSDLGANFSDLSAGIPAAMENKSSSSGLIYNQFFVDEVSGQLAYVTSGSGLFKTVDGGQNWASIKLPVEQIDSVTRGIAIAKSSGNIVMTSVGSTVYKSTDGGFSWQTQKVATTGIINYILIDPELPQIAFAGIYSE